MKKSLACLLAGILSIGVFSMVACNFGDGGEEIVKIPEIPEGVVLNNVAPNKIEETAAFFNKAIATSTNLRLNSYASVKSSDLTGENVSEKEIYSNAKYLGKDGKTYGEVVSRDYDHNKYKNNYNGNYDEETVQESGETAYLKDKNIGIIYDGGKDSGYVKSELIDDGEWDKAYGEQLQKIYIGGEDYYKNDGLQGLTVLNAVATEGKTTVQNIVDKDYLRFCGYGIGIHLAYVNTNDFIALLGGEWEIVENLNNIYDSVEVADYNFTMKADETRLYINQQYKIYLGSDHSSSWECNYILYADIESDVKENSFKSNYINLLNSAQILYLDCDTKQVAEDVLAGKGATINIAGGKRLADGKYTSLIANLECTTEAEQVLRSNDVFGFDVSDSKLVIKVDLNELDDSIFDYYETVYHGDRKDLDMNTTKKYLVVKYSYKNEDDNCVSNIYIPLN